MSAVTASLCSTLMFVVFVSADPKLITAESGQDVILPCRAPNNNIIVVKWSRADLEDEYVILYQDGHFDPDNQHPFFKNRVDLQDRQMKDGDASLILKDVTINDEGTYECGVYMRGTRSWDHRIIYLRVDPPDQKIITAESGQDVNLTCRAPNNNNIIVAEWSRADLRNEHVLLYRDEQFDPHDQHPSFKNRVDLQDRQMKDGDVSLILKNVTINDAGTYECGVIMRGRSLELISIIHLHVVPPGQTGGQEKDEDNKDGGKEDLSTGLIAGLTVSAVLLLLLLVAAVVGFFKCRKKTLNPADPHEAEHLQPEYQKIITAESGQVVTLTCRAPNNNIIIVKWSRADLGDKYVLLYQDGDFVPDDQHPSFRNRVDLQDRQMKDGDVSLILKDVTIKDEGAYECRVYMAETDSWKLINISLSVVDPPELKIITAESGQDVTLTCRAPNSESEKMSFISLSVDPT